jgi:hypothetical protein
MRRGQSPSPFSHWPMARPPVDIPALGASGSAMACTVLFACLFPHSQFLLYFVIPVPAWLCAMGLVGYDAYKAYQASPVDRVAHMAHIGVRPTHTLQPHILLSPLHFTSPHLSFVTSRCSSFPFLSLSVLCCWLIESGCSIWWCVLPVDSQKRKERRRRSRRRTVVARQAGMRRTEACQQHQQLYLYKQRLCIDLSHHLYPPPGLMTLIRWQVTCACSPRAGTMSGDWWDEEQWSDE